MRLLRLRLLQTRRGLALITTLGCVALATLLVMALLSTADVGRKEASTALDLAIAHLGVDNALQQVKAQLLSATTARSADGKPLPWTSQPGAIRVYQQDGSLSHIQKLYTAAQATATDPAALANDLPADWAEQPDSFVDMNRPQRVGEGQLFFPILDPRAYSTDPLQSVEGFSYQPTHGASQVTAPAHEKRLPMPVRWMYQRQDGSLTTLDAQGRYADAATASAQNPVILRYAYWVDDETTKINVNTASEGSFWDTPRADSEQERSLATHQPTRREYHRLPGHPAGVCLSSVLLPGRRLQPASFISQPGYHGAAFTPMQQPQALALWRMGRQITADYTKESSWAGNSAVNWTELWPSRPFPRARQVRYATPEELLFDMGDPAEFHYLSTEIAQTDPPQRPVHSLFKTDSSAVPRLIQGRGFLTTHSAGSEVSLQGSPRIALWCCPAETLLNQDRIGQEENSRDTVYHHKIAKLNVHQGKPWFVQRATPGSGAEDYQTLADEQNLDLHRYLQRMMALPVPGYASGGAATFADKYGADAEAISLQMLDYLRNTGLADGYLSPKKQFSVLCPGIEHKGFGQVNPLQRWLRPRDFAVSDHPQGQGRMLTLSEVAIIITCRAEVNAQRRVEGTASSYNRSKLRNPGDRELEVALLVETFCPSHGWPDYRPYASVALVGGAPGAAPDLREALPALKLQGQPLELEPRSRSASSEDHPPSGWSGHGGALGLRALNKSLISFKPIYLSASSASSQPYLQFEGAGQDKSLQLKLALYDTPDGADAPTASSTDLVSVTPLSLPDIQPGQQNLPLPRLPRDTPNYALAKRYTESARSTGSPLLSQADIVQSLTLVHGDYRMTTAKRWHQAPSGASTQSLFVPHPQWGRQAQAHDLADPSLPARSSAVHPSGLTLSSGQLPDFPHSSSQTAAITARRLDGGERGSCTPADTGDFDNGLANSPDGPYLNRPDEGPWAAVLDKTKTPYFDPVPQLADRTPPVSQAAYSPHRLLPSPIMFGSLPTGTRTQVPWQTLLFRPQADHYGSQQLPDYLLLDHFRSFVVEPELISQKFETTGQINLNHQLAPFSHIHRSTALHALLKAEAITAIPDTDAADYKTTAGQEDRYRRYIDAGATVQLWQQQVQDQGRSFLTAGQVCSQHLVPEGLTTQGKPVSPAQMQQFWAGHRLTGDNSKEMPYARIYPRLTTRSNSYRIHFISQTLRPARGKAGTGFDHQKDQVLSTATGTAVLRRVLPEKRVQDLPDYLAEPTSTADSKPLPSLDRFHHLQLVEFKIY